MRVSDPVLAYKQQTSPKDHFNEELLKAENPTKNLALLSPTPPSLDATMHPDLLMEDQGCEPQGP